MEPISFFALASTAMTAFNTYSGVQANKARAKENRQSIDTNNRLLSRSYEAQKAVVAEMTEEYSSIVSYKVDMLRQEQLHKRQVIGYNLLKSGIGITPNDSAGLLMRLQAHNDEMEARAQEMGYFHNRPRMKIDKEGLDISIEAGRQRIRGIKSALPWEHTSTIAQGGIDLMNIFNKAGYFGDNKAS
jgi:hypothetical protein